MSITVTGTGRFNILATFIPEQLHCKINSS